ncbi:MAG: PadR family transcriptional regulator [Oscillospiraceae bacterium]|jgi:PadR family transcriptional regulator PadR|nr:PadR family transcriptional regulator [Oscillospiraceae bacterium]
MNFQVGSALLDACVLANVSDSDVYGYSLTQSLKDVINISESTLYPVLRRLQSDNLLTVYDSPFQGRNRRYYRITDAGKQRLTDYANDWREFVARVNHILSKGGASDEQRTISEGA